MDLGSFAGLPTHVLLVHIALTLVPLAAVMTVLSVVWPAARKRLGIFTPIAAVGALVIVIVTRFAGQWLLGHVSPTPLIEAHAKLGLTLEPWAWAMAGVACAGWAWFSYVEKKVPQRFHLAIMVALAIVAVVIATITVVTVIQVGEAGTRAVWNGVVR
jgi:hypothetical protein